MLNPIRNKPSLVLLLLLLLFKITVLPQSVSQLRSNPFTSLIPCKIIFKEISGGRTGNQFYGLILSTKIALISGSSFQIEDLGRFANILQWSNSINKDGKILIPASHWNHTGGQWSSINCLGEHVVEILSKRHTLISADIIDIMTIPEKLKIYLSILPLDVSFPRIEYAGSKRNLSRAEDGGNGIDGRMIKTYSMVHDNHHMVIHFRAGDVFLTDVNDIYHQTPCNYLKRVIEDFKPTSITILTEFLFGEGRNPCAEKVIEWFRGSTIDIFLHQGNLEVSFLILANARTIVLTGLSSFSFYAAVFHRQKQIIIAPVFHPIPKFRDILRFVNYTYIAKDFLTYLPPSLPDGSKVIRYSIEGFPQGRWERKLIPQLTNESIQVIPFENTFPSLIGHFLDSVSFTYILGTGVCDNLHRLMNRTLDFLHVANSYKQLRPPWNRCPSFSIIVLTCNPPNETRQFYRSYNFTEAQSLIRGFEPYLIRFYHINEIQCKKCSQFYNSKDGNYDRLNDQVIPIIREYEPFSSIFYIWIKRGKLKSSNATPFFMKLFHSLQGFQFHQYENNSITTNSFEIFGSKKLILFQKLYGILPKKERGS